MSAASSFEVLVLPHLRAAYNLARWIARDPVAAEDIVQEASLRALRYYGGMRGENPKAWFLTIVRRCCFDRLDDLRSEAVVTFGDVPPDDTAGDGIDEAGPEHLAHLRDRAESLRAAIEALAPSYREIIILRELEDLSYKEIARIVDIPIGTVMSRLARARSLLQQSSHLDEVRDPSKAGQR